MGGIAILFIILPMWPVAAAWRSWNSIDQKSLNGVRKFLSLVGLIGVSVDLGIWIAFVAYTVYIGGFGTHFPAMLKWIRPGLWLSVAVLALSSSGKGKSRISGVAASIAMLVLWIVPIWGM